MAERVPLMKKRDPGLACTSYHGDAPANRSRVDQLYYAPLRAWNLAASEQASSGRGLRRGVGSNTCRTRRLTHHLIVLFTVESTNDRPLVDLGTERSHAGGMGVPSGGRRLPPDPVSVGTRGIRNAWRPMPSIRLSHDDGDMINGRVTK